MPFIVFYSTQLCYKGYWLPLVKEICCSFIQAALNALSWKKIKEFRGFFFIVTTVRFVQNGGVLEQY